MSLYAIGDIHGCFNALTHLLEQIDKNAYNQYVFLGDYIDKGPDSRSVINCLNTFSKKNDCVFIRGNHEILMMDARLSATNFEKWMMAGGESVLDSFEISHRYTQNGTTKSLLISGSF